MPHKLCKRCGRELRRKGPNGAWFCPGKHFYRKPDLNETETEEEWLARAEWDEERQNRPEPPREPLYRYLIATQG